MDYRKGLNEPPAYMSIKVLISTKVFLMSFSPRVSIGTEVLNDKYVNHINLKILLVENPEKLIELWR